MSYETISAEQIEGLEDLITEILNRKIAQMPLGAEDMEQLKKSPAGTVIRLEERVNALDKKIDEIRAQMVTKAEFAIMSNRIDGIESRIDGIESRMATKQDLERMATKKEQNVIAQEVKVLNIRLEEYGKRLAFFQTVNLQFFRSAFCYDVRYPGEIIFAINNTML
jgi:tetrahydromethanopterin S-methyltransferase subunit G